MRINGTGRRSPAFHLTITTVSNSSIKIPVITIDGPTASGKGTVARIVAEKLHFHYLDSGALYRLTALSVLRSDINTDDIGQIASTASRLPCRFSGDRIFLADEDVTDVIRKEEVGNMASKIAAIADVRKALRGLQTRFRKEPGLVADGRDMGTVLFPDAALKVFLTASADVRAQRRYKQLMEKGIPANIENLRKDLIDRDQRDTQRKEAPLVPAQDALTLDTSNLGIDETVERILNWFAQKSNK